MLAVAIAGHKKSGKTALLALVAEALERKGLRVAVVKYSSHAIDRGNIDAFWLMRPGRRVVNVSPEETAFFWPTELSFAGIAARLDSDVILLEGGDVPLSVPRILCFRDDEEGAGRPALPGAGYTILATYGVEPQDSSLPHFAEMDPATAEKLAALVLEKGASVGTP